MKLYKADTFKEKFDLGIGVYRDDDAKLRVLPVVRKAFGSLTSCQREAC